MNLKIIISIILIINFVGCTKKEKLKMDTPPPMQAIKKVEPIVKNKGSLYSRRGPSLFADKKDLQRGDIIQVEIDEFLKNDSNSKRDTSKDNSTGINGGLVTKLGTVGGAPVASSTSANGILGIGFSGGSNNIFSGSEKSSDEDNFETNVSAIIEQTYQNGNYFIKGTKQMLINGQKQFIMISGIIRPYDISPDNTVESNKIANLKILFSREGTGTESLEKPWGSEFIESISPF